MARRFLTNIDLLGFALINAMLHPVSSDPSGLGTSDKGRVWFNSTSNLLKVWNGTAAIDLLARANHSGTQLASTISDLAATVQAYRLDQFAAPTAAVSLGSQRITSLADPTSAQDAATRNYIDTALSSLASGQTLKGAVRVATTTNISITSAPSTADGVTLANGDVILLTGQTTASQNGPRVFTAAGAALNRATNWDTTAEAVLGSYWIVREGANADTFALLTNDTAITLDTTSLTFVFRGAAGSSYTVNGGLTLSGTTISVNPGTGIVAPAGAGTATSLDTSVVARKVTGLVPATTSGSFSVSGSNVTVNHALSNSAPIVSVTAGATPLAGSTTGAALEVEWTVSDANNIVLALSAAPATGNYILTIVG